MPFVYGFLRLRKRHRPDRPTDPDYGVDEGVDPGYGVDEDLGIELPEVEPPDPPHGIWPPLTPDHPWRPVDPGYGLPGPRPPRPELPPGGLPQPPAGGIGGRPPDRPQPGAPVDPDSEAGQLPVFPPGAIHPPLPPGVHGKYLALVLIKGPKGWRWHYTVIDADASFPKPQPPAGGIGGRPPARPEPA